MNLAFFKKIRTSLLAGSAEPTPPPSGSGPYSRPWLRTARILLLMLIILLGYGCMEKNQRLPEQLLYVRPCPPKAAATKAPKPCLCLEFMLGDALGTPTTSDGKVTVKLRKGSKLSHNFKVKQTDFRKRTLHVPQGSAYAAEAARSNPFCCQIGPIPVPISPGQEIAMLFEFERPDGQRFRREVRFSL